jgi:hypothetical protein
MPDQGWSQPFYAGAQTGQFDDQYIRKWSLMLGQSGPTGSDVWGPTGDLAPAGQTPTSASGLNVNANTVIGSNTAGIDFRVVFRTIHGDQTSPGRCEITVYNLRDATANAWIREFNYVELSAGYEHGRFGVIFSGTIMQYKKGRESAIDSYLTIYAMDGDPYINFRRVKYTVPPGTSPDEQTKMHANDLKNQNNGVVGELQSVQGASDVTGGVIATDRPQVMYGLSVDRVAEWERTTGNSWSVQNGVVRNISFTGYSIDDEVVINSRTGMVGVPEVTQDGIELTMLLNPSLFIRQRVRLDNRELNRMFLPGQDPTQDTDFASRYGEAYLGAPQTFASTQRDGHYCIIMIEYEGDTRGMPWYAHLICLNVDPTNPMRPVPGGAGFGLIEDIPQG